MSLRFSSNSEAVASESEANLNDIPVEWPAVTTFVLFQILFSFYLFSSLTINRKIIEK